MSKSIFILFAFFSFSTIQAQDDFETWPLTGWTDDSGINISQETSEVYQGSNAVAVEVTSTSSGVTNFYQSLAVNNTQMYTVCFHVKHTEGNVHAEIRVGASYYGGTQSSNNSSFQAICRSFTASFTGNIPIGLRFPDEAGFDGSELVYVDNYTVVTTPLAVKLTDISATVNQENIHIKWTSAIELDHDYYSLEWSPNGIDYTSIHKISVNGDSNEPKHYNYTHANPTSNNYYRLKSVSLEGSFEYSKIIQSKIPLENFIKVYPTYTKDYIQIDSKEFPIGLNIYDIHGKLHLNATQTNNSRIDLSNFNSGIYFLHLTKGNQSDIIKIMKN